MYDQISTPAAIVELDIMERNIQNMIDGAAKYGITHRPHTKVHKSVDLSRLQEQMGCRGITCAKLSEAEIMADGGLKDILVAYPLIGEDKWERFAQLAKRVEKLRCIVNSYCGAEGLSRAGERTGGHHALDADVDDA